MVAAATARTATQPVATMPAEWIGAALGVTVTIVAWALFAARRAASSAHGRGQSRLILIRGDYQPAEVHVRAGEPARLIFRREETTSCSERVVFPTSASA